MVSYDNETLWRKMIRNLGSINDKNKRRKYSDFLSKLTVMQLYKCLSWRDSYYLWDEII